MKARLNCGAMSPYRGEGGGIVICRVASREVGATHVEKPGFHAPFSKKWKPQGCSTSISHKTTHASIETPATPTIMSSYLLFPVHRRIRILQLNLKWIF